MTFFLIDSIVKPTFIGVSFKMDEIRSYDGR